MIAYIIELQNPKLANIKFRINFHHVGYYLQQKAEFWYNGWWILLRFETL